MNDETLRRICSRAADDAFRRVLPGRAERYDTDATHADDAADEHLDDGAYQRAVAEAERAQRDQIAHQDALWRTPLGTTDAAEASTSAPGTAAAEGKTDDAEPDADDARESMLRDVEQAWCRPIAG